ncbi:HEXXH motif domain-containing protein [Virgisporangium aliadipatigenens]|uniref:HEXXH motif domain-containing protein n=1 Tax=Virgisporangium aliadipatigenens TaxID=741659 RepID=A0A8J3YTP9_9ACTN|nr:HEXXH motif-containing putative peptide modification protein [Virgisporangium aliadipatigenens]GIJ49641.1 HEXXH motif domain-containing protein [Virgisporangium aliadipatigenens]
MMRRLRLDPRTFAALAHGGGGAAALAELRHAKLNEHLLLLRHLVHRFGRSPEFEALCVAQKAAPEVVSELLAHPWNGAWLANAVRDEAPERFTSRLGAVALVAAMRAGTPARVEVPASGGAVMLPDTGAVALRREHVTSVRASVAGERVSLDDVPLGTLDLQPLRRISVSHGGRTLHAVLDDLDPQRDCHRHPLAGRLTGAEVESWRALLHDAWRLLVRHAPDLAAEIGADALVLVPLHRAAIGREVSVTSTDVFGAFGLTMPAFAPALAANLVHELQHSKLNVMLRLRPAIRGDETRRYFAPWRNDPRPITGLLHGIYAFVGVATMWRRFHAANAVEAADYQFALLREQLRLAVVAARGCGLLTTDGRALVAALSEAVEEMLADPLPPAVVRRAGRNVRRDRLRWALRNRSTASVRWS